MANASTTSGPRASKGDGNGNGNGNEKVRPVVPFVRASGLHNERMEDVTRTMNASSDQDFGVWDVPAYGYLRSVLIHVEATGGSSDGTANDVALTQDGPFNAIKNITFQEPNGSTVAQFNSGFELYLVNKYGGYRYQNDPKMSPVYSTSLGANANFEFMVRIPIELNERDALGSLPNQNSGSNFKVRMTLAGGDEVFTGTVATYPDVRIRTYIETWDQPPPQSAGQENQVSPPAVNTTQYWNPQQYNINSGQQGPRLSRMGNYIRNLVFIMRDSNGKRIDGWPDPWTLYLDARPKTQMSKAMWRNQIYERYGYDAAYDEAGGPDTGVWPFDFCHEFTGQVGHENRDMWLPTLMSTRLEPEGNYPTAGTLHVYTNDVTIAGTVFM